MIASLSLDLNLEMKKGNKKNKYLNPDFTNLKLDSTISIFLPLKTLLRSPLDIILINVKHLSKKFNKNRNIINSNYDYAGRLDKGWSKQAPKGFTDPSLDFLEKEITKRFKQI